MTTMAGGLAMVGVILLGQVGTVLDATLDAEPIPPQPTVVVPPPAVNWGGPSELVLGLGTMMLADVMAIPEGAVETSDHALIKHGQEDVARVHQRLQELPAEHFARYKRPCRDGIVRIPVPFDNGEYGLEVLTPIAEGLYQEKTAFIAVRGWDYIAEVLSDCRNGQGGTAVAQ